MIHVKSFVFNPFMENTYVLSDETGEAVVVDPGCYEEYEQEMLAAYIEQEGLKVIDLINTHGHIDHVLGNYFITRKYGVKMRMHELDVPVLKAVESYAPSYGFNEYQPIEPDSFLNEGDLIRFGNTEMEIMFLPGHAPGHIGLLSRDQKLLVSGDVLFRESVGRTDLPGGDHNTLLDSIREKLFTLDDEIVVYCGHGPETTLGHEKRYNPFCAIEV
ncbi:MBL fold metallo-hydrolase [Fulvivirga sedimenti]|jgi:glyoxylase-like metal-dependent hydrolase (beta-lactamase superfamily II)|uniref:MBL fold metallo-hydrolase n=1 Tax=Fulvivirga sedimenti TaxID=2879465 RepID=A0A9X1HW81_9BACT|nr:MBL fold metallo-hydrolase [Fulvivirga sedimenti]MCA6078996.1 MBL fold metallo-hydrolase [Fulvivirga sedimenti]